MSVTAASSVASRREAAFAAVEAYNRSHPEARLPHPAARLLATMFAEGDVCCLSQQALMLDGGFTKTVSGVLRALVEAGFLSRQAGSARVPDSYRLLHRLGDAP